MSIKTCPCKGCTKRHLRCHSTCEEYLEWKEYVTEENNALKEQIGIDHTLWEMRRKGCAQSKAIRSYYADRT